MKNRIASIKAPEKKPASRINDDEFWSQCASCAVETEYFLEKVAGLVGALEALPAIADARDDDPAATLVGIISSYLETGRGEFRELSRVIREHDPRPVKD